MAKIATGSYRELIVWQKSMDLVDAVCDLTERYPQIYQYDLGSHARKSAISIPSNIAEGRRRGSKQSFHQFLKYAYASGAELESQIEIAKKRPFAKQLDFTSVSSLLDEVMRMLNVMLRK